jgi:hypothetical protein
MKNQSFQDWPQRWMENMAEKVPAVEGSKNPLFGKEMPGSA